MKNLCPSTMRHQFLPVGMNYDGDRVYWNFVSIQLKTHLSLKHDHILKS